MIQNLPISVVEVADDEVVVDPQLLSLGIQSHFSVERKTFFTNFEKRFLVSVVQ